LIGIPAGQATWGENAWLNKYSERQGLAIGDFGGDGSPDIFASADTAAYRVWLNQGEGSFR
jgi:hypothetical protein